MPLSRFEGVIEDIVFNNKPETVTKSAPEGMSQTPIPQAPISTPAVKAPSKPKAAPRPEPADVQVHTPKKFTKPLKRVEKTPDTVAPPRPEAAALTPPRLDAHASQRPLEEVHQQASTQLTPRANFQVGEQVGTNTGNMGAIRRIINDPSGIIYEVEEPDGHIERIRDDELTNSDDVSRYRDEFRTNFRNTQEQELAEQTVNPTAEYVFDQLLSQGSNRQYFEMHGSFPSQAAERMPEPIRNYYQQHREQVLQYAKAQKSKQNLQKAQELFRTPVTQEDLDQLAGWSEGGTTRMSPMYDHDGINLSSQHKDYESQTSYVREGNELVCHYGWTTSSTEKRGGLTIPRILSQQFEMMVKLGVHKIKTNAAKGATYDDDSMIGYKVWPRFGFEGPLKSSHISKLPVQFRHVKTIQELYALPGGRQAWEQYGDSIDVEVTIEQLQKRVLPILKRMQRKSTEGAKGMRMENEIDENEDMSWEEYWEFIRAFGEGAKLPKDRDGMTVLSTKEQ